MKIWIDADACPNPVKEIVFRAAQRRQIPVTLVANQRLKPPNSRLIDAVQVSSCLDAADHYLLQHTTAGDLVITADIPLAAGLVARGVAALNPRGELYTENNIAFLFELWNHRFEPPRRSAPPLLIQGGENSTTGMGGLYRGATGLPEFNGSITRDRHARWRTGTLR